MDVTKGIWFNGQAHDDYYIYAWNHSIIQYTFSQRDGVFYEYFSQPSCVHLISLPQELDSSKLLQTHITGALVHGRQMFAFLDLMQYPHDSNLTLNCLLRALVSTASGGCLTRKLYIQLDNCGRENKNKYFLACMALLVKNAIVEEVLISFLMVGHTHEGKVHFR